MDDDTPDRTEPGGDSQRVPAKDNDFLIVGLGASAGGIQALKEFFTRVPKESGMAYVVILHMSPEHESRLAEILQVTSAIPVTQVTHRVKVVPNHVYVIPPSRNLSMTDGHLALTHMIGSEERRSPVDLFFRTLAETNDLRAVSVILSGTGADGSIGLKRIKENGGVIFVQDPEEAEYTDMPQNAIATGLVDYVLPVAEIPSKIVSFNEHRGSIQIPEVPHEIPPTDEQSLRDIFAQLRRRTGHDFSNYKRATMLRRIERRLGLRELPGLSAYASFLREHHDEAQVLMKDLLISVTNFFRDHESVEALSRKVLPRIFKNKSENDHVRVWVAGCATGEEAYTLAMLLSEAAGPAANAHQIQLFATDLDAEAIAVAREGYYKEAEVTDLSHERIRRFFIKEADGYRVRRELRETILFAVHNVIKDPPFSHLDLVSCRNLLIYLNRTAQSRLLEVMHFALNPGGYMFLGASESIDGAAHLFSAVDKDHHLYQSRPGQVHTTFPVPEAPFRPSLPQPDEKETIPQELRSIERLSYLDLHQGLLEQYAPPSVVVNEDYDIVHMSDRAGRFLQFTGGEPSKNLLKIVRPELRVELRSILYQAAQSRTNVEVRDLQVSTDEGKQTINLIVRPVLREGDPTRGLILVLFEKASLTDEGAEAQQVNKSAEPIALQLEEELMRTKAHLHTTVEQHEIQQEELLASNEELQAMNEELRSAAEELETSKEELQSLNEELTTVNQELKIKIEELSQASNDFSNLMNSTDIGTIFLDLSLRVKLFTPRAREAFNLIASDAGRPLLDITNKLAYDNLLPDVEHVLDTLRMLDREVRSVDGHWYEMRILPYRTAEGQVDGIVITFIDVTESKLAKLELERAREALEVKVTERTSDLKQANDSLWSEVAERRRSELARLKLLSQLVNAQEVERHRLARDLHDQLGQQLTGLRLKLESLKRQKLKEDKLPAHIDELLTITDQLDADVDFLAWELRPIALDDLGLPAALRNYVAQWSEHFNIATKFHVAGLEGQRLSKEIENNLYRIAQEALNNVAKHSHASRVDVLLERRDQNAVLIIEDNGVGFEASDKTRNDDTMGITSMRERAALIGGTLEIESIPEKGTTVFVRVHLLEDQGKEENI